MSSYSSGSSEFRDSCSSHESSSDTDSPPPSPPGKKAKTDTRPVCQYGDKCYRKNPAHLKEFSHPHRNNKTKTASQTSTSAAAAAAAASSSTASTSSSSTVPVCPFGTRCYRRNPNHFKEFAHPPPTTAGAAEDSGSDTDHYCSGEDEAKAKKTALLKNLSNMTEEQQKELLKTAFEEKDKLEVELQKTKADAMEKEKKLKDLLVELNKAALLLDGEKEALEKDEVSYFELLPERSYKEGSAAQLHLRLAESQFYRLLLTPNTIAGRYNAMGSLPYQLKKVQYVVNPKLVKQFKKSQDELEKFRGEQSSYPVLAFHGTEEKNISPICEEGFHVPYPTNGKRKGKGKYGCGGYFSEYPGFSIKHITGANKLLLFQVLPGKIYHCQEERCDDDGGGLQEGYDSHSSPCQKEIVMFHSERILPCYIVHYKKTTAEFSYNIPPDLRPQDQEELLKLYRKAQRVRKSSVLVTKHVRLCGTLVQDHETIGRMVKKHGGRYVDDEPPPYDSDDDDKSGIPLHVPGTMGYYPFKGKYHKLFNILLTTEKAVKAGKKPLFDFVAATRDAYDVDISVVREEWLYDSLLAGQVQNAGDYEIDMG